MIWQFPPKSTFSNNKNNNNKKQSVSAQSVEELSLNYRFLNRVLFLLFLVVVFGFSLCIYSFSLAVVQHTHFILKHHWLGVGFRIGESDVGGKVEISRWWSESKHNVNNIRIKKRKLKVGRKMLCKQIFLYYVVDVVNVMKEQPSKSGCFFLSFFCFASQM